MNTAEIKGHLGRDPIPYTNSNGTKFIGFPICHNKSYRRRSDGEMVHEENWYFCHTPASSRVARICNRLSKGSAVTVKGEPSPYQGKWRGANAPRTALYLHWVSPDHR